MEVGNTLNNGLAGIHAGRQGLAQNSFDIARAPVAAQNGESDVVVDALIESKQNLTQVQASARVVQAASDTIGSIIDITV
ncbi:MAG: hypothetical protein OQK25_01095 [Gammaproteobacteria bacterium]|nr:hypothetical protein [Gammaproteobacteria bacterium]